MGLHKNGNGRRSALHTTAMDVLFSAGLLLLLVCGHSVSCDPPISQKSTLTNTRLDLVQAAPLLDPTDHVTYAALPDSLMAVAQSMALIDDDDGLSSEEAVEVRNSPQANPWQVM